MPEKKDIRQGTLAPDDSQNAGSHGVAPRLWHRAAHRADQRRDPGGPIRYRNVSAHQSGSVCRIARTRRQARRTTDPGVLQPMAVFVKTTPAR